VRYQRERWPSFRSYRPWRLVAFAGLFGAATVSGVLRAGDRYGPGASERPDLVAVALDDALDALTGGAGEGPAWDLPNLDHPRVDDFVRMFTGNQRSNFARYLQRSGRYERMISQKLEERGMPQDLLYLAMIESGFNSTAYSRAHASGLWQFIAETGRRYGLDVNRAVDERNDPVKATDAALDYLTYLHNRFDSWYLAAAAYNTGENRVGRIMREETGSEKGDEYSYYRIRHRLPRETRDYVPLMVAAARIAKEPEKYGFESVERQAPLAYDEVRVEPASSLAAVARASGTTVAEIKRLNPQLKLDRTRNDRADVVRIPAGKGQQFAAAWTQARAQQRQLAQAAQPARQAQARTAARPARSAQARSHQVRRGENLSVIAQRHGVTVHSLRQANNLRNDRIRAGATLRIPAR
jgi:membrane-bound lytic murein transglycosylase D